MALYNDQLGTSPKRKDLMKRSYKEKSRGAVLKSFQSKLVNLSLAFIRIEANLKLSHPCKTPSPFLELQHRKLPSSMFRQSS
jgi:hypothetical protein